jgi:hypothetical protein
VCLLVEAADLVDRHHACCLTLDQFQDLHGELRLRQLLPRRRGRRPGRTYLVSDPADEDVGRIGSQRAVVRRIELVNWMPDPGIGDDLSWIAAGCRCQCRPAITPPIASSPRNIPAVMMTMISRRVIEPHP